MTVAVDRSDAGRYFSPSIEEFITAPTLALMLRHLVRTRIGQWTIAALIAFVASACASFFVPFLAVVPAISTVLVWVVSFVIGIVQLASTALFTVNAVALYYLRKGKDIVETPQMFIDAQVYIRRAQIAFERLKTFDWKKLGISESAKKIKILADKFIGAVHRETSDETKYDFEKNSGLVVGSLTKWALAHVKDSAGLEKSELFSGVGLVDRIMHIVFEAQDNGTIDIPIVKHFYEVLYTSMELVNGILGRVEDDGEFPHVENPYGVQPYYQSLVAAYVGWWDHPSEFVEQSKEEVQRKSRILLERQMRAVTRNVAIADAFVTFHLPRCSLPLDGHPKEAELREKLKLWKDSIEADARVICSGGAVQLGDEKTISFASLTSLKVKEGMVKGFKDCGDPEKVAKLLGCEATPTAKAVNSVFSQKKVHEISALRKGASGAGWKSIVVEDGDFDIGLHRKIPLQLPVYFMPVTLKLTNCNYANQAKFGLLFIRDEEGNLQLTRGIVDEQGNAVPTHPWSRLAVDGVIDPQKQIDAIIDNVLFPGDDLKTRRKAAEKERSDRVRRNDVMRNLASNVAVTR
ncbi:MAG: hypothetical protein LBB38_00330 [Puniceicoccales bacterium]|nr:hypothetical protein [Puniceicoccales bacterium]